MDLPGDPARAPELCLIDELAHTNAPGLEHRKRFEDVEDVLEAGIDVFSTLNVQHLESLNDQVAELSGVRVRETVPDPCSQRADEVVLVDLTPEALLERLRAGKVYPAERIEAALNGFFRIENLTALRETALRQVAEEVVAKRIARARRTSASGCWRSSSRSRARSGWSGARGASRSGSARSSTCSWVRPPGAEDPPGVAALRQLDLGARRASAGPRVRRRGRAPPRQEIRERGTTYVLVGESPPRAGSARLREPLPQRIMRAAPRGVDVRIVAARREQVRDDRRSSSRSRWRSGVLAGWAIARRRRRSPTAPGGCGRSCCPSPAPRSRAARWTRRCGSRAPRTRR